jgi:SAM-dependent methyltransferase
VLDELTAARAPAGFLAGERLAVLDVGAGCGAMTLGLLVHLAARGWGGELTLTLVDHDSDALAIGAAAIAQVAAALGVRCAISARDVDVTGGLPRGPFDLIVAGTIVNELAAGTALVTAMMAALAPRGVAIVIEPALRITTRGLHAVRDALITAGTATVLAPCARRAAPCPALADERDWCHDHRPAELPPRTRQLATVTGLRDGEAKLAFLALARPDDAPPPIDAWRVVDDPHAPEGQARAHRVRRAPAGCRSGLLRRHRSVANRAHRARAPRRSAGRHRAARRRPRTLELGADDTVTQVAPTAAPAR